MEKVRRKRPELSANNSWILHHDNAPVHTALPVREFLVTKQIIVLEHPAYSPDLAPSDFFLFQKIKEILKGIHFDNIDDIWSNTTAALKAIPQNQFQNCFEGWTRRWHRCIASQGEYFEGDHGGIQQLGMQHFYRDKFANFIILPRIYKTAGRILIKLHKQRFTSPSRLFALATEFCTVAPHTFRTINAVFRIIHENVHQLIRRKESAK